MVVTKELLKELFAEYNTLYFDGRLRNCDFSFFSKGQSILGKYNSKNDKNGKPKDKKAKKEAGLIILYYSSSSII